MKASQIWWRSWLTVGVVLLAVPVFAQAQTAGQPFQPFVGQPGKDVVWVPTPQALVDKMLDLAKVTPADDVIDLGSGDGRLVIAAAKRGATAHGIEYDADLVRVSERNAAVAGVTARATFAQADLFESDFSRASVITMFLLPEMMLRLRPSLLELTPGTRIVSNTFTMGDWSPDATAQVTVDCVEYCTAYFWAVPAKVDGSWTLGSGALDLRQDFQHISGTLTNGSMTRAIAGATLRGSQIGFAVDGIEYTGRVNGGVMQGTTSGDTKTTWSATRRGP